MAAIAKKVTVQARKIPAAIAYSVADESELKVPFEDGKLRGRISPYREALNQLLTGKAKLLRFDSNKARNPLYQHSRKMKLSVLFAEQNGMLYVKLDAENTATSIVRAMIEESPKTKRELIAELAARGLHDVVLDHELKTLSDNSQVRLGTDSRWIFCKKEKV